MGLRGPGAKPIRAAGEPDQRQPGLFVVPTAARQPRPWEADGLTRAERVIAFVESLRITSGMLAGERFRLRDWQKDIIRRIYDPAWPDGTRQVRQALLTMARKNGKSQIAAALALCHLCGPEAESRGQVYSAAADRNQAALIFGEMEAFIVADPALSARLNIQRFAKRIEDMETGSTYVALSSDARKAHGLSPSFVVCDELAQWHGRELYDNLVTGTGARAEPLVVVISTQSSDPISIMSELTAYAEKVAAGVLEDPTFAGFVYTVPMDADPWDEGNWHLANPALGDFRSLADMRQLAKQAQRMPSFESSFRCLFLNQPVSADERWLPPAEWDACQQPADREALKGRRCFGGLDLGSVNDLCSFALYFPDDGWLVCWSWCPGDNLVQREEHGRVPYSAWVRAGHIEATQGRATNKRFIALRLAALATEFELLGIAFDRWGMPELERILSEEGIELPLQPWGQGFKDMGPAMRAFEEAVLDRRLQHDGNPVLRWAVSNVVPMTDPTGARKPDKAASRDKIDPLVAAVMAVGLAVREPVNQGQDWSLDLVIQV